MNMQQQEDVIETKKKENAVKCYGCKEIVPLIKKHYNFCPDSYSPCSRPDCIVVASPGHITSYSTLEEEVEFVLDESFQVSLYPDIHNTLVLHDQKHGLRFLLVKTSYHSWMSINRLDSRTSFDVDIEASVLVPGEPGWEIDHEDERDYVAAPHLRPQWTPLNVDLLETTDHASPNKEKVEAHLIQLPLSLLHQLQWSLDPINIQISIKQKKSCHV